MSTLRSAALAAGLLLLPLAGCGGAADAPADTASEQVGAKSTLKLQDAWVKAAPQGSMTAAFGVLANPGDRPVTVTAGATEVAAMTELHEVVKVDGKATMRPKEGGFEIQAHGTLELAPGGNHLMLMGLVKPLRPGDEVSFTLTTADGVELDFTAPVKKFTGADEHYSGGGSGDDMGGM